MKLKFTKKVLVVDDDGPTREFVGSVLEKAGYTVLTCKNGREGVTAFMQSKIDLVITDIAMPQIDGLDAIIMMRKTNAAVPIIAISGAERSASLLKIADYFTADATLSKPFDKRTLLAVVEKVLATG